jgi:hypothetical protein
MILLFVPLSPASLFKGQVGSQQARRLNLNIWVSIPKTRRMPRSAGQLVRAFNLPFKQAAYT